MFKDKSLPNSIWQVLLFVTLILPILLSFRSLGKWPIDIHNLKEKKANRFKSDSSFFDGYYIILYTKQVTSFRGPEGTKKNTNVDVQKSKDPDNPTTTYGGVGNIFLGQVHDVGSSATFNFGAAALTRFMKK